MVYGKQASFKCHTYVQTEYQCKYCTVYIHTDVNNMSGDILALMLNLLQVLQAQLTFHVLQLLGKALSTKVP